MTDKLLQYLPDPNTVKGGMAEMVEIVQREAPLVVGGLLRWHIWYNILWQVGSIVVFITILQLIRKWIYPFAQKSGNDPKGCLADDGDVQALGFGLPALVFIAPIAVFFCHFGWVKPLIAPRIFLLEYLSNLMK